MEIARTIRIEQGTVIVDGSVDFLQGENDFHRFSRSIYRHYGIRYPKFYKMSPLSQLGFLASELLLREQDLSGIDPGQVALLIANSSSSLHTDSHYQQTIGEQPSPAIFVYTLPNIMIGEICIRNGFRGEGIFFIQEQYDREFLLAYAEALLRREDCSLCLAGWIDTDMGGEYLAELCLLK